jgi:hypothetical protein
LGNSTLKKVKNTQDLGKNTQTVVKTTLIKKMEIDRNKIATLIF